MPLYQSLHPEDAKTEEDDITIVTLQNVITDGLYNDLGFMVRNRLVVLVEAQSTWSPNIVVRALMYLMKTYNDYFTERDVDLYASKKIGLPCPELYVVYIGDKKDVPDSLRLDTEFFAGQKPMVDATVRILRDGRKGDILSQYIAFTRVCKERIALHGRTRKAVEEIVRICRTTDILAEYMKSREKEVKDIMFTLYDEEEILRRHDKTVEQRGIDIGIDQGISQGIVMSLRNLLANTDMTKAQAMDALGIAQGERDKYAAMMA
ncbi:MAG: hypothetical protein IJR93_10820 [Treponema sp.]|nr:hypothetical protein [Treponema sp.]